MTPDRSGLITHPIQPGPLAASDDGFSFAEDPVDEALVGDGGGRGKRVLSPTTR